jgi:two-component system, cell cycle sensor histidine kinase and response regulator CckA
MKTVRVPDSMQALFAKAEEVVARFFQDRIDDPAHGTIQIHGERYVLLRGAALSVEFFDLVRSLYGDRGAEADELSRAILFDLAHSVGRSDAKNFHDKMQLSDPIARMSAGPVHFAHAGWAFVELADEAKPTSDDEFLSIYDHPYSFESDAWVRAGRASTFPVCIMGSGYSSGWCEESFGVKLVAAEILCRAKGDHTCRFVMAPPERIAARIQEYIARHPELAERAAGFQIPDFFARKRAEEALKRQRDELERELRQKQKLEALGRLAGGVAHDFNNIISVVMGHAMLAQRRGGDHDAVAKDLAKIIRAAERAASLTDQLLAFGRSQVARNELLDLNRVVAELARMIERLIGDHIEFRLDLAADAAGVYADRAQIEQILVNLAVNARDAMPAGGTLTVSTVREGERRVMLTVADTGQGMDEETRARAFEPFFTTKGQSGTGLGLSTVYGIVASAGGTIDIETSPGMGCNVRISLPRHERESADSAHAAANANVGTVLVAEDRSELREVIGEALNAFGYGTILAKDAADALRLLTEGERPVEILLTDVVMPGMSGVELASRALELRPSLSVLFMSGYAPDPDHRALFSSKRRAFLQKPFTPQELAEKLAALSE